MKMNHFFYAQTVLLLFVFHTLPAGEREAVIVLDGCTGFVVQGNLLVTAKHCQHPDVITVTLKDQTVTAHKAYSSPGEDGPVIFRLQGGPFESLPVANQAPRVKDAVYSLGYPGGHWARIEGEIIGGNGIDLNYTNHRIATGNSGGPLLNSQGEVIGIALHVDANLAVHRSGFSGWKVTSDAIAKVKGKHAAQSNRKQNRLVVAVFSSPSCKSCQALKQDVRQGHFNEYDFQFIEYENGKWSDPEMYAEFWKDSNPKESLSFPTIWIKGTQNYKVGYNSQRKEGLLGWLRGVVRMIFGGLIGSREQPPMPIPDAEPDRTPQADQVQPIDPIQEPESISSFSKLLSDVAALREEALNTQADLEKFKESGVIGKIKGIAILRKDKDQILERVAQVKQSVASVRNDLKENPVQFLWGLFGIISGLLQRRFLKEEVV
ncbi:MAG: trypsin-like peptidase domain-containing protein [Planctomycetaceae bacterium]|nr:trypsin-like peptidase domain-containing protein [Planctomycetaceae bacterium]